MRHQPLILDPAFKNYLWGGTRLKTDFNKQTDLTPLAESWELSCHKDGPSRIANGQYQELLLSDYLITHPEAVGGKAALPEHFPILIKFIDAKDNLSVQVHPDDAYALQNEGESGKTELWYIVDCEEDASLFCGFAKPVSKEEFRRHIQDGTLPEILNRVPVHKGDTFYIQAGTLHAIGKGILIAEIQQSSNSTYRVYDYGRVDKDGNSRPLHIEKAMDVTSLHPAKEDTFPKNHPVEKDGFCETLLKSCSYFTVSHLDITSECTQTADRVSFHHLLFLEGAGTLEWQGSSLPFSKGSSIFIPAGAGAYHIRGKAACLLTTL